MSLSIVSLDDEWISQSIDRLRVEHSDPYVTLRQSEAVAARIVELAWLTKDLVNPIPWIVLRGGLVFWTALHEQHKGPIGMVLPERQDRNVSATCVSPSLSEPHTPVILDWVIASGHTMETTVQTVSQLSGSSRIVIVAAASASVGERCLEASPGVELELVCAQPGLAEPDGLLLGFDMGDCTAAMPLARSEGT